MSNLSPLQLQQLSGLLGVAHSPLAYFPTVLIIGPRGSGKRTVAAAAARELGMDFIEIRAGDYPRQLRASLFGTQGDADRAAEGGKPPGIGGIRSSTLIYLSGIENLEPELINELAGLAQNRRYNDSRGRTWYLGSDLWVVGSLTSMWGGSRIGPEHWLCTTFERRLRFWIPWSREDIAAICLSIVREYHAGVDVLPTAVDLLLSQGSPADGLFSVRRWVEAALSANKSRREFGQKELVAAMGEDLYYLLPKVRYRGVAINPSQVQRWQDQFAVAFQPIAMRLVKEIAERYYIPEFGYHRALGDLIRLSDIPRGSRVTYCKWQHMGKSSQRVAHALKNQANWTATEEIDLRQPEEKWPDLSRYNPLHFLLADDFVGTGQGLCRVCRLPDSTLARLLGKYPAATAKILIIAGFEDGLARIRSMLVQSCAHRAQLIPSIVFGERDQCFAANSQILTTRTQRVLLRQCCIEIANEHYPQMSARLRLGFGGLGALVVFHDTVPNNSLPILWHDTGTWHPLFPASGLPVA